MFSSLPSMTYRTPPLSASAWTIHVAGSSVTLLNATALAPGLSEPLMFLPSQLNSRTTCVLPAPHSPLHVPFSGWPNCAKAGEAARRTSSEQRAAIDDQRETGNIYDPFFESKESCCVKK